MTQDFQASISINLFGNKYKQTTNIKSRTTWLSCGKKTSHITTASDSSLRDVTPKSRHLVVGPFFWVVAAAAIVAKLCEEAGGSRFWQFIQHNEN